MDRRTQHERALIMGAYSFKGKEKQKKEKKYMNRFSVKLVVEANYAETSENPQILPIVIGATNASSSPSYGEQVGVTQYNSFGAFWRGVGDYDVITGKTNAPTLTQVNSGDVFFSWDETLGGGGLVNNYVRVTASGANVSSASQFYEALRNGTFTLSGPNCLSISVASGEESQLDAEVSSVYANGAFGSLTANDLSTEQFRNRSDNDKTVRNYQQNLVLGARSGLKLGVLPTTTSFVVTLSGIYVPNGQM